MAVKRCKIQKKCTKVPTGQSADGIKCMRPKKMHESADGHEEKI